jgi:bifunctional non-homologous end joining protein LigD
VTFDQTKAFSRAVGQVIEEETPREVTTTMSKAVRPRKIFIDWSQNDRNKTTVAPYSMRGFDRPTVSTPLTWREVRAAVKSGDSESLVFEAPAVLKRVAKRGDVAKDLITLKQRLPDLR